MSIHKVLARTDGGFIGLRDLLTNMAQANGATFKQAAAALYRLLMEAQGELLPAPAWRSYSPAAGMQQPTPQQIARALELLQIAATKGEQALVWETFDDDIPF